MIVQPPARTYRLGEPLPPIPFRTLTWPWAMPKKLQDWASDLLKYPLGTVITDTFEGKPVVVQIETHTTYGLHPEWPAKPHKGTSIRALADVTPDGAMVAVTVPPDGWGTVTASMSGEPRQGPGGLWAAPYEASRSRPRWLVPSTAAFVGACAGGPPGAAAGLLVGLVANHLLNRA